MYIMYDSIAWPFYSVTDGVKFTAKTPTTLTPT